VHTRSGTITANVDPISVASNQPVDPPQWDTAVWVRQSSYPSAASNGTSYIYGHACHHHVCPFTRLSNTHAGDTINLTTATGTLTYLIKQTGLSPKDTSSLPSWASDSTVPRRIVLVTCAYEQGDISTNNFIVDAYLSKR
jgi:LPXTG-site transpeptidase (sortase) family protein